MPFVNPSTCIYMKVVAGTAFYKALVCSLAGIIYIFPVA